MIIYVYACLWCWLACAQTLFLAMHIDVSEHQPTSDPEDRHNVLIHELPEHCILVMLRFARIEHPNLSGVLLHGGFGGHQ
jgi:hypothetical protein